MVTINCSNVMDYLNIALNSKCSKLLTKSHVLFSSRILDKRNRSRILVFTDDLRILVLTGNSYSKQRELQVKNICQIITSPGRDQVIVLHMNREAGEKKDLLCAFQDDNRNDFTGEEDSSRLETFMNLLKTNLINFDCTFNADNYFRIASKIHVAGKRDQYTLKFVCTSFPHHTDYLKFDIRGKIIKYNVPVLFGKQHQIQDLNGCLLICVSSKDDDEPHSAEMNIQR